MAFSCRDSFAVDGLWSVHSLWCVRESGSYAHISGFCSVRRSRLRFGSVHSSRLRSGSVRSFRLRSGSVRRCGFRSGHGFRCLRRFASGHRFHSIWFVHSFDSVHATASAAGAAWARAEAGSSDSRALASAGAWTFHPRAASPCARHRP